METSFKEFLNTELAFSGVPDDILERLTQPDNLEEWRKSFTHYSMNAPNYDFLLLLGENQMKTSLTKYVLKALPALQNPEDLRDYVEYFTSNEQLNALAVKRGFVKWIQSKAGVANFNLELTQDVIKAWFGNLLLLGDKASIKERGAPLGTLFCDNYITSLLNDELFSADVILQPSRNKLTTRVDLLGIDINDRYMRQDNYFSHAVYTRWDSLKKSNIETVFNKADLADRKKKLDYILKYTDDLPNSDKYFLLGSASGATKELAKEAASKEAVNTLDFIGLNGAAAKAAYRERLEKIPGFKEFETRFRKSIPTARLDILQRRMSNKLFYYALVALNEDGSRFFLHSIISNDKEKSVDAKKRLIELAHSKS